MGLFDNIIGTATEWVEPLGMDTIVDDSIPPAIWWNLEQEKEEENPNIVEWDDASSIIVNENSQPTPSSTPDTPPTIPDIDIGGSDMFNFSYVDPNIPDAAPVAPAEEAIPDSNVTLNAEPIVPITEGVTPPPEAVVEVVPEVVPETPEGTSSLIDLTEVTPEAAPVIPEEVEVVTETPEETSSLIDLTEVPPEDIPTIPEEAEVTTTIDTNTPTPDNPKESDDDVSPETLEQKLNNRISTFVADLENIKAAEKILISEKRNTLAQLTAEQQIVTANFWTERQEIEEDVKKLEEHQVQIDQTIALVKNTKIV